MNTFQKSTLIITFLISSISFSQEFGKEYGIIEKGKAVEISHRRNSDNSIDFLYNKSEPGSYTIHYTFENVRNTNFSDGVKKVVVKHNKGTIFKLRASDPKKRISYKSSYNVQRGITDPKFEESFTYVLPFSKDTEVKLLNGKKEDSLAIEIHESTDKISYKLQTENPQVLASRRGVVTRILTKVGKKTKIYIEHTDGTYAVYSGFDTAKVKTKKGTLILPGDILGNLEKDKDNLYTLNFRVIYKTKNNNETMTGYIKPSFITLNGIENLQKNKTYTADYNDDIFFDEFTKKEKKKYLKTIK